MDENQKKFDAVSNSSNVKKIKKMTPAISFVDEDIGKRKKNLNLIKEEENKENLENQDN
jgi:hypothetical protein